MELNAEQIIKALECCLANDICDSKCGECQYKSTGADCMDCMLRDALALINSQEQRIKELAEENERLKSVELTCGFVKPHKVLECPIFDEIARTKADTVRQMQERLKQQVFSDASPHDYDLLHCFIDGVAEELLESGDG